MSKINIEELATFCKKKGFVFAAGEIYGGLSGFFDFGPLGVELKNNLKQLYWNEFVLKREDIVGQDGSTITNPRVWKASGHTDNFADLVLTTKKTNIKIRADTFIEDKLKISADGMTAKEINELIKKHKLTYEGEEFNEVKDFNLMFQTYVGADASKNSIAYLRPETAQSIFPNFKIIAETSRMTLPFGITQIGKAYRNEISPRDFVFRVREFEQIEMEYFFNPQSKCETLNNKMLNMKFQFLDAKTQNKGESKTRETTFKELTQNKEYNFNTFHAYWLSKFFIWFKDEIDLSYENMRIREHTQSELSHYSYATFDIEYNFPMGFREMFGMANRGDYDLTQHTQHSKTKMEIFDETTKSKITPHVIEPTIGVERLIMAVLCESYNDDKKRGNIVLNIPPKITPYKVAVLPLVNKEKISQKARQIFEELISNEINAFYDKSGSIGRRYARQDEIGTPFCLTIDFETIEDGKLKNTITLRQRESIEQKRINIDNISEKICRLVKGNIKFKDL